MASEIIGRLAEQIDEDKSNESETMLGFCRSCVNVGTPICKECSFIARPSGRFGQPSCFLADDIAVNGEDGISYDISCQIAGEIAARLIKHQPLPVRWILEYNGIVAKSGR